MSSLRFQIQPFGGGLRDMVPAPNGIRAVGDGARREEAGVVGEATDPVGVMGFMCKPDMATVAGTMTACGTGETGGMAGSTFSRWAFR